MSGIVIAIIVVVAIGLIGAILLVVASKVFAVTDDVRVAEVENALPGANCGACGYAGCSDYAKAVVDGAPVNQCMAGGAAVAETLARIMGVEVGAATEYRALVACCGDNEHTKKHYEYHGIKSCAACNLLYNGVSSCPYGCIGFGDCANACKFGAIEVINGVAHVDRDKCTGCGVCKTVCPKKIIFVFKTDDIRKPVVMCSNHKNAPDTRRDCTAGCLGCGKCVTSCPKQAIEVRGNVARIDYEKCVGCGLCAKNCPVHCIRTPAQVALMEVPVLAPTKPIQPKKPAEPSSDKNS